MEQGRNTTLNPAQILLHAPSKNMKPQSTRKLFHHLFSFHAVYLLINLCLYVFTMKREVFPKCGTYLNSTCKIVPNFHLEMDIMIIIIQLTHHMWQLVRLSVYETANSRSELGIIEYSQLIVQHRFTKFHGYCPCLYCGRCVDLVLRKHIFFFLSMKTLLLCLINL